MSQNSRNQGFSYYICLLIEGSGSGSIPLTNGSESGRKAQKHADPVDPDSEPEPEHCHLLQKKRPRMLNFCHSES
jgi:hypothetical protein